MKRKAILHIGPMKTGSTSIQHWLHLQADALADEGFQVPHALGRNMSRLATMALAQVVGETPIASDAERVERLAEEVAGLPRSVRTLIFSGEMLGQLLHHPKEVRAVKRMLDPFCDEYVVIAYLRRQDELSVSRYSTALRRGERRARPLSRALDYDAMLSAWAKVFGDAAMRVRIFDRKAMVGGDVVADFAETAGLPFTPAADEPIDQNPSLLPEAQAFLQTLAERIRGTGFDKPFADFGRFEEINKLLSQNFAGKGMKPGREEALEFYETVRDSNERVRAKWFPDQATLFSEDFGSYPQGTQQPLPADRVLDVAMEVLARMVLTRNERPDLRRNTEAKLALGKKLREERRGRRQRQRQRDGGA